MFASKRILKKDRNKKKVKKILLLAVIILMAFLSVLIYLHISFGENAYLNPVVKNTISPISILEKKLNDANINYKSVISSKDGLLIVYLSDDGQVILSSKQDIRQQVSSLQLILSRLTIEGKKLKILDLRFERPVISF